MSALRAVGDMCLLLVMESFALRSVAETGCRVCCYRDGRTSHQTRVAHEAYEGRGDRERAYEDCLNY